MTHQEALSARSKRSPLDPNPSCRTELLYERDMVIERVRWAIYRCPNCGIEIATMGGRPYWANHVVKS